MAENGSGRMDRIERALDRLEQIVEIDHEYFKRELKALTTAQVVMQGQMDEQRAQMDKQRAQDRERQAHYDERVDKLVTAIGELIGRLPVAG